MRYQPISDNVPQALIDLQNSNPDIVVQALLTVCMRGQDYAVAVQAIEGCISHTNIYVRGTAVECIGHVARIHHQLPQHLLDALQSASTDTEAWVREKASDALDDVEQMNNKPQAHSLEEESTAQLLQLLQAASDEDDLMPIISILRKHPSSKQATALLLPFLQHPSSDIRWNVAETLTKQADPDSGEALFEQLQQEKETEVRTSMIVALGAVGYQPSIPYLIGLLRDAHADTRGIAAWSLGALCARDSKDALVQALRDEQNNWAAQQMQKTLDGLT